MQSPCSLWWLGLSWMREEGGLSSTRGCQDRVARAGEPGIALNRRFVFQSSRVSWAEAREPRVYRPILIAVLMRFLQQLTGITPILVYLQTIFDSTSVVLVRTQAASTAQSP